MITSKRLRTINVLPFELSQELKSILSTLPTSEHSTATKAFNKQHHSKMVKSYVHILFTKPDPTMSSAEFEALQESELESIRAAKGDYYKEDELTGYPLHFTTVPIGMLGDGCDMTITSNNNIVPETSAYDAELAADKARGGCMVAELSKDLAANLLKELLTNKTAMPAPRKAPASNEPAPASKKSSKKVEAALDDVE